MPQLQQSCDGPSDEVLRQLRIPFVRRATIRVAGRQQEAFVIDIGVAGAFVECEQTLRPGTPVEISVSWPGSELPFTASCRVAWWHAEGVALSSKSLPSGAGLQFVSMGEPDRLRLRGYLVDYCRQHPRVRRFLSHWPEAARHSDDPTG